MPTSFNNRLRQLLLLALIFFIGIMLVTELNIFLPGLLGGVTLYILTRKWYYALTIKKKWSKSLTAFLFILGSLILIAIPVYLSIVLISPKVNSLIHNQQEVIQGIQVVFDKIEKATGQKLMTANNAQNIASKISGFIPLFLNSTANLLTNLIMLFFLYYYLLTGGRYIEKYLEQFIPLKQENVDTLAEETIVMVRANALGIPVICFVQGIFAAIGYLIFGVKDWGMWGFVTGIFAFFPLLGTMIIWVPLVIYLYSTNQSFAATGLLIYSVVVTGNVDYITRLSLLKKIGDVHPMITVLGVIVGLKLFGFMGLIFGPLLISYFVVLVKIYMNEFVTPVKE
jgi:predicted PurR-regulated permease PerM